MSESLLQTDDVQSMSVTDLAVYLEANGICEDEAHELAKRGIDGKIFLELSREDIATIFPEHHKFVLGMRLYKIIQNCRAEPSTQELLADMSDQYSDDHSMGTSSSGRKRPQSSDSSTKPKRACTKSVQSAGFTLPLFSPDIERCIKKDAFYTGPQRNKLIRESCNALCGYCRQQGRAVSIDDKKELALKLCHLAPKSLGDPGENPEKSLYGQIVKWYQNHVFIERRNLGETSNVKNNRRASSELDAHDSDEDEEGVEIHLKELLKETSKKVVYTDKVIRLQSLTCSFRHKTIQKFPSSSRAQRAIEKYPFLMKRSCLILDLVHTIGMRCSSRSTFDETCKKLSDKWYYQLVPAIMRVAEETKIKSVPDDATLNAKTVHCLEVLLTKLKPKSVKSSVKTRLSAILCFADSTQEGLAQSKDNNDAFILAIGDGADNVKSMVIVCRNKVITDELGRCPLVGVLALIAVHYVYQWQFNTTVKEVMEFIQEKLLQDPLPQQKQSVAYNNLFRVVSCFEAEVEKENELDPDATQLPPPEI